MYRGGRGGYSGGEGKVKRREMYREGEGNA